MTIETLGTPVTDPAEANLMQAEYGLLLNKVLSACNETHPGVAIAACISAGFCIAVDATPVESKDSARRYLESCIADAFASIDRAFEAKAGAANGNDTGVESEGSDQTLAD